jgi:hypothetical protein
MTNLEVAAGRLFHIWRYVEMPLEITLTDISEELRGGTIVTLETFQVHSYCDCTS